ncbi:hypothetical protein CA233_20800 [Sphingomonas sp. ABOLD]|uniref:Uncharacterized protein n=1 Tax=Sphingomonas trueperi TaxID=53317 RepID=A0A7X6BCU8_9SPHN|nr:MULTISPECIES: hypothetical protein [Sphingomonas]NJB98464.1 hypothetical protein [Sphingomonas trueperi]RSV33888.1 hypothetical protein CA234_22165 [Sphingomonas sp. ABOLE]RSV39686.1 hypothetical protein CA233_20800 [Sphingomonas sp. ABOLD]
MKLIALAAALTLASPALAQTFPVSTIATARQIGGYAPATMWANGQPQPGDRVVFEPSRLTPSEAFPPPPARAHYPVCTRGQTDECLQRAGQ